MTTQKKALLAIYVISSIMMMFFVTMTTIAYIMDSYAAQGIDPILVQQLVSLPGIFGLIASFFIGPIAMKINKKYLTMAIGVMILIYMLIFAIVGKNGPFLALIVAAAFGGIVQGTGMTMISSMLGEFVEPAKSASAVAIGIALMRAIAMLMSIVGGAIAAGNGGQNWPYTYYLGLLVIPVLIVFAILMPKHPDAPAADAHAGHDMGVAPPPAAITKFPLTNVAIGVLSIFSMVFICGFMFFISVYVVNEFKLGTTVQAGLVNSLFNGIGILVGFTYGLWAKLFKKMIIIVSFAMVALGLFAMMAITTSLAGAFIAAILIGWGFNMINPYTMGYIIQVTPQKLIPVGISLFVAGSNVGMAIAIIILNFFSGLIGGGLKNILLICAVGMAMCTVFAAFVYKQPRALAVGAEPVAKEKKEPNV